MQTQKNATTNTTNSTNQASSSFKIPSNLQAAFDKTDWSLADSYIAKAVSGGPSKDGIPALDNPSFINLSQTTQNDDVQAIVIADGNLVKVYPYNILAWHEIINDTVAGQSVAVTFCPLCGSAVAYERRLDGVETTFGVSGWLIESNMVMYDRASESLWQQSTGQAIAGKHLGQTLNRVEFQLLSFAQIRAKYQDAQVVSEDTGYNRDYTTNPYAGYESTEGFYFAPSKTDERYPSKAIFIAFSAGDTTVGIPADSINDNSSYKITANGQVFNLEKKDGELDLRDASNQMVPFYFEMWFSWAVQHQDNGIVFDPGNN